MSVVRLNSSGSSSSSSASSLLSSPDERQQQGRAMRSPPSPVAAAAAATTPLTPPPPAPANQQNHHHDNHHHHGYLGHFVLLCGFDSRSNSFALRDPDGPARVRRVSARALDEARAAFGTDEDLLLVELTGARRPASCVSVAFAGVEEEEGARAGAGVVAPAAVPATP